VEGGDVGLEADPAAETVDHKESSDLAYARLHLGERNEVAIKALEYFPYVGVLEDALGPHIGVIGNVAEGISQVFETLFDFVGPVDLCGVALGRAGAQWR